MEKLKKMGFTNAFYSSHKSGGKRGVAILLSNKLQFQLTTQTKDKDGRYILVKGKIDHKEVTLLNVYMPPGHDRSFIKKIFDLLTHESSGTLICGGDFNIQLQPKLDLTNLHKRRNQNSVFMRKILQEFGMIDIWRDLHPTDKQFTYYSPCQAEYSKLDYFFISAADRHRVCECKIGVRDVSDHSGVYLHLDNKRKNTLWRLNTSLLNDGACKEYIKEELKDYLLNNDNGTVSPNVLWDAWKAVLRGKLIAFAVHKKKEKYKRLAELQSKLKNLETQHSTQRDPRNKSDLKSKKMKKV